MRMYSFSTIGEARKKSLRSREKNLAPLVESEMTLLRSSFVSRREAAGDPVSYGQLSLLPPATKQICQGSDF